MRVFDKSVHCQDCGELLHYEKGSILWQHTEIDLCPKCTGKRIADEALKGLRKDTV